MSSRRQGRIAALQALYGLDLRGRLGSRTRGVSAEDEQANCASPGEAAAAIELQEANLQDDGDGESDGLLDDETREFAAELCEGVVGHRERIDRLLERCSHNWRLERMTLVDRNILRIAVFELCERPEVPPGVVINEAIELGKAFGCSDSGAFINGLLDRVAREVGR